MKAYVWALGLLAAAGARGESPRRPVLVELFTSEGCSSCPPADALLAELDRQQPVADARAIVLSEHVDYWNHDGWTDPFSSPLFTTRQEEYARRFVISGPYTPQMVVDGEAEFVGNHAQSAGAAIRAAAQKDKIAVRLVPAAPGAASVRLEVDAFPAGKRRKAGVWVAIAEESGVSSVRGGENKGRTLHHVAIVRELRQVGSINERAGFAADLPLARGRRLIAFVQESGCGRVWGAAEVSGIQ